METKKMEDQLIQISEQLDHLKFVMLYTSLKITALGLIIIALTIYYHRR